MSQAASRASLLESHDDVLGTFIIGREEPMDVPRIDFMQHFIRDETLHYFGYGNSQALNKCVFDLSHMITVEFFYNPLGVLLTSASRVQEFSLI